MMTEAFANIHFIPNSKPFKNHKTDKQYVKTTSSAVNVYNMRQNNNNNYCNNFKRGHSFVVGQKLRESKWFQQDELGIFCAVVESGFIVENKRGEETFYGVAIWTPGYEKSKNSDYLRIYTLVTENGKPKIVCYKVNEFWPEDTLLKINNKSDKTEKPLTEELIRSQINCAQNSRKKWHNSEHFAYFCRYGPVEQYRTRKLTETLRWHTAFFWKWRSVTAK